MSRICLKLLILFCVSFVFPLAGMSQDSLSKKAVVLELFTSQGDINSTPAEKILHEILEENGGSKNQVYALAMHVDFWNRYGWKDPFSTFRFTNRLHNYTSVLGLKETYTPLLIINGNKIVDASNKEKIKAAILAEQSKSAELEIDFSYSAFDDTLDVTYTLSKELQKSKSGAIHYLGIAITESGLTTQVTAGDNKGKTLKGESVVKLLSITNLVRKNGIVRIPLKGFKVEGNKEVIVFVQRKKDKAIIAVEGQEVKQTK
jgi:hypothetical protein